MDGVLLLNGKPVSKLWGVHPPRHVEIAQSFPAIASDLYKVAFYFLAFGSGGASSACALRGSVRSGIPVVNPV
jgi:hypothetical protein